MSRTLCDCCNTIFDTPTSQLLTHATGGVVTLVCPDCEFKGRMPTVARRLQRQPTERAIQDDEGSTDR